MSEPDHDGEQIPLCPMCESAMISEKHENYIYNYSCRMCKGVFDHPLWVDVKGVV